MHRWISLAQRRWAFWLCALAVLVLARMKPVHHMPTTGWDKANHALAFFVLAVLGTSAYPARWRGVLLALLVYGASIEIMQWLTGYRDAEWLDWLADGVGLALAWPLARRAAALLSGGGR
jgi:VanZ family protein